MPYKRGKSFGQKAGQPSVSNQQPGDAGAVLKIRGIVAVVMSFTEHNSFAILRIRAMSKNVSKDVVCKGTMPRVLKGVMYEFTGTKEFDARYNQHYLKFTDSREILDATPYGIVSYLESEGSGIGIVLAERLVELFGLKTIEMLRDHAAEACARVDHNGFTLERAAKISAWLSSEQSNLETKIALYRIGLTPHQVGKLLAFYGVDAAVKIKANCYGLTELDGIGFNTADKISELVGVDRKDKWRIRAGVKFSLAELSNDGDVCVRRSVLIKKACDLLDLPQPIVADQLEEMLKEKQLATQDSRLSEFVRKYS